MSGNYQLFTVNCLFILGVLCVLIFLAPAVSAQETDDALEREAQAIDKMLMCPVCPAETIDQAQVEISFQMRAVVRELLAEGRTRQEVLDYFVDRYGADILAAPPKSGSNLVAWILPIVGVAAGLVGVFFVIRAMTGSQRRNAATVAGRGGFETRSDGATTRVASTGEGPHAPTAADDPDLAPYLEIADRLIASRSASLPIRQAHGESIEPRPHPNPPPEGEGTTSSPAGGTPELIEGCAPVHKVEETGNG